MNTLPHFHDWSAPLSFLGSTSYLQTFTDSTAVAYGVLAILALYHMLHYLDYLVLPVSDLAWNSLVYLTPARVISILDTSGKGSVRPSRRGGSGLGSQWQKSDAMRRILGLDSEGFINRIQQTKSVSSIGTLFNTSSGNMSNDTPPGLGNWDNSCYQNSVIQGLASLSSLSKFLGESFQHGQSRSTKAALSKVIAQLNDSSNAGKIIWTPRELKSMSSWQQQDAQEYYSKLLDEVEREIRKTSWEMANGGGLSNMAETSGSIRDSKFGSPGYVKRSSIVGFPSSNQLPDELASVLTRNPLEGLLAQRVGCLRCGFVEGLSLIPFNCLTVPLGKQRMYDVRTCLDDYTTLEYISGVDCTKCTLLQAKKHIERIIERQLSESSDRRPSQARLTVTAALQSSYTNRLSAVDEALNADDFSDNTLLKKCQIPNKTRISPTKSRQAIIGRPPKSLVIHINRSVFDELSGLQRKNLAYVQFPPRLDLARWCLGSQRSSKAEIEGWSVDPSKSMLPPLEDDSDSKSEAMYKLRAVITHYGRHENGHYICYRKHRLPTEPSIDQKDGDTESWWRLSDEEVSEVSEETVLAQGGVFMLFYEKTESKKPLASNLADHVEVSVEEKSEQTHFKSKVQEQALDERIIDESNPRHEEIADGVAENATPSPMIFKEASKDESTPPTSPTKSDLPPTPPPESTNAAPAATSKPTPNTPSTTPTPIPSPLPPPLTPPTSVPSPSNTNTPPPPKSDSPKPLSSPPMRTAGPRGGRGSVSRAGTGMGNVGSMVEAN